MDKMREEFEAWAESFAYDMRIGVVDGINGYLDEMTQGAWMGWQAARQSSGQERGEAVAPWRWIVEVENASPMASLLLIDKNEADTWSRRAGCTVFPVYRDAATTDAQSRIAELEAQLAVEKADSRAFAEENARLFTQLTESREREGRMREAAMAIAGGHYGLIGKLKMQEALDKAALAAEKEQK